jgi:hypothetical protein
MSPPWIPPAPVKDNVYHKIGDRLRFSQFDCGTDGHRQSARIQFNSPSFCRIGIGESIACHQPDFMFVLEIFQE